MVIRSGFRQPSGRSSIRGNPGHRPRSALTAGAALAVLLGGGCSDLGNPAAGGESEAEGAPELLVFAFDRSYSVEVHELEHARALTRQRVGSLTHGDRVVALEVLERSLDEEPRRWSQQVPEREFRNQRIRRDSITRTRFIRDVRDYIERFSDPEERTGSGADILSTLHLVASELRANPGHRSTLVLYSDMLQSDRDMNMEGLVRLPPDGWVEDRAARGALPDLAGLCVVVVGARRDTRSSQLVKDFWLRYFEATGATFHEKNWDYRPVRVPERPCPGG